MFDAIFTVLVTFLSFTGFITIACLLIYFLKPTIAMPKQEITVPVDMDFNSKSIFAYAIVEVNSPPHQYETKFLCDMSHDLEELEVKCNRLNLRAAKDTSYFLAEFKVSDLGEAASYSPRTED